MKTLRYLGYWILSWIPCLAATCQPPNTGTTDPAEQVVFYPVYSQPTGENYKVETYPDDQFIERLAFVLEHYGYEYTIKEKQLLVSKKLYDNEELVHNYTQKAQDTTWLKQRDYPGL